MLAFPVCALLAWGRAAAEPSRVVLIDPGAELERAVRAALEPWQVEISVIVAPSPGASAPSVHEAAAELASRAQAGTLVWISEHEAGHALWIYDAALGHVLARPLLSTPPFDAPSAAAIALSLKTLLRHSQSAPAPERYGAPSSSARGGAPRSPPAQAALPASPAAPPAQAVSPPAQRERDQLPHSASRVEPEAGVAARFRFIEQGSEELRVGLGVSFWPRASWGGLSLRAAFGPSLTLDEPRFQGSLASVTAAIVGRFRWEPVRWLRVSSGISLLADFTRLDGVAVLEGQRVPTSQRVVPGLGLEAGLDWLALPWLRVGLRGGPAWLLRTQRYALHDDPVLALAWVAYELGLVLGFGLHQP